MTLQQTMAWPTALSFHPKQEQHQPHNSYQIIDVNLTHCFHNGSRCPSLKVLFTVFQAEFLTAMHSRRPGTVLLGSSIQHYSISHSTHSISPDSMNLIQPSHFLQSQQHQYPHLH